MFENRLGGDILYVKGRGDGVHSYYERNKTRRHAVRLAVDHRWNEQNRLAFKSSVTYDDRKMSEPAFRFEGSQLSSFHELSLVQTRSRSEWVGGRTEVVRFPVEELQPSHIGGICPERLESGGVV